MNHRSLCPIASLLCVVLALIVPARASSIGIARIQQITHAQLQDRRPAELHLASNEDQAAPQPSAGARPSGAPQAQTPSSVLSVGGAPQDNSRHVELIETGEITGKICDCGDIIAESAVKPAFARADAGGFPKWAWLGLLAIPVPLAFIGGGDDTPNFIVPPSTPPSANPTPTPPVNSTPTPTPLPTPTVPPSTPTPEPIPEPATLLLLGSGLVALGASARRRQRAQAAQARRTSVKEGQ
jgi:hypothetical protein